jgi:predicted alpha/beta hydrolase family esterase
MPPSPNIVLVHGAWADGSSWSQVIERLQADGYTVTASQLPETSLADDVARVHHVLTRHTGPTILVAHSASGHCALVSHPDETCERIVTAANAVAGT